MNRNLAVVIQAGGRSSRMGRDKGLVPLGNKAMVEWVIDTVSDLADDVVITTNNKHAYLQFGLRMVSDKNPGAGALHGFETAFSAVMGEYVLVLACDMPFVNKSLLQYEIEQAFTTGADIIVPQWEGRFQPMHAVYRLDTCKEAVANALEAGHKKVISFYEELRCLTLLPDKIREYSPTGRSFRNINTPEELAAAEKLVSSNYH